MDIGHRCTTEDRSLPWGLTNFLCSIPDRHHQIKFACRLLMGLIKHNFWSFIWCLTCRGWVWCWGQPASKVHYKLLRKSRFSWNKLLLQFPGPKNKTSKLVALGLKYVQLYGRVTFCYSLNFLIWNLDRIWIL